MTRREVNIICDHDNILDLFMYLQMLRRSPDSFSDVLNVRSEERDVINEIISEIENVKESGK